MIDDAAFTAAVAQFFKKLVKAVDAADPDVLEADATGDMVTMTAVKSGEKVIVNTQKAVNQLWVAGKGAGIHFNCTASGQWLDDKGKGIELHAWVKDCVKSASGVELSF